MGGQVADRTPGPGSAPPASAATGNGADVSDASDSGGIGGCVAAGGCAEGRAWGCAEGRDWGWGWGWGPKDSCEAPTGCAGGALRG